jgi:hypothetical protein
MFKGVLIDPYKKLVRPIRVGGKYPALKKLIGGPIQGIRLSKGEIVYVHEEGLLQKDFQFFRFKGPLINYPQPLAGYGLVIGVDEEGETADTEVPVDLIRDNVDFPDLKVTRWTSGRSYTTNHPVFGEMNVFEGPKPIFEVLNGRKVI